MKKKVALIFGGRSLERDISIITAMQVLKNVDKSKYAVEPIFCFEGDFYAKGVDEISKFANFNPIEHDKLCLIKGEFFKLSKSNLKKYFKPDVALVCCHGGEGENGIIQALLEFNSVPYTSPSVLSSSIGMDKGISKQIFDSLLLNTLPCDIVTKEEWNVSKYNVLARVESVLEYPLIVKPCAQGSSIGICVAKCMDELIFALDVALKFDSKAIVEHKLCDFVEVNCAAYRDKDKIVVSSTEQPLTLNDFLTFEDKYEGGGKMSGGGHLIPADIGALDVVVRANTERIYRELELNGVVRIDFLVDKVRNKVYVNEMNTIPGSMAYYLFEDRGVCFKDMLSAVIENAIEASKKQYSIEKYTTNVLEKLSGCKRGAKLEG